MNMDIKHYPGTRAITIFCLLVLYSPMLVVAVYSFNSLRSISNWGGFTFDWYIKAFNNPAIQSAALNSLSIAFTASLIATAIAVCASLALLRGKKFKGQGAFAGLLSLPLMIPEIITAVASLVFFVAIHLTLGLGTILLAHIVFCIPFAYWPISARMKGISADYDQAAMDLYASRWACFHYVTLPMLMPGIASGMMLAFIVSLDDFIVANMVAGPGASTLPMTIYSMVRIGFTPEINAVSTLLLLTSTLFVGGSWLLNRGDKQQRSE